jgi:hypothetical protein
MLSTKFHRQKFAFDKILSTHTIYWSQAQQNGALSCWLERTRVTRLGKKSFIGRLFTLGNFLKITEVAQIYAPLFSTAKVEYQF